MPFSSSDGEISGAKVHLRQEKRCDLQWSFYRGRLPSWHEIKRSTLCDTSQNGPCATTMAMFWKFSEPRKTNDSEEELRPPFHQMYDVLYFSDNILNGLQTEINMKVEVNSPLRISVTYFAMPTLSVNMGSVYCTLTGRTSAWRLVTSFSPGQFRALGGSASVIYRSSEVKWGQVRSSEVKWGQVRSSRG